MLKNERNRAMRPIENLHKNIPLHHPMSNMLEKWDIMTETMQNMLKISLKCKK